MEGLPYDFGIEDNPDDEKDIEKKPKKLSTALIESLKEPEVKLEKEPKKLAKENLKEIFEDESVDNAPELDTEAPLEHLSRVEVEAISQTIASERLAEIRVEQVDLSSESLAAVSFLENIQASGDIDAAYTETLAELGTSAMALSPEATSVEIETAPPVDPESLVEAARSELSPDVSYRINRSLETANSKSPEARSYHLPKRKAESRPNRLFDGIVDYVVGRRFGRLKEENRQDEIEQKLSREVNQLKVEIESREIHVRQLAQNRTFEKPRGPIKPAKAETIGKVVIDSEMPELELTGGKTSEIAGISAHTMKHGELLKVAQRIEIQGNSLRQMYDAHLVGEKGLRRVVAEYLRGGNYRKILKLELLERQKDFERDPKLRDQASTLSAASSHAELDDLLQRSGIDWSEPQLTQTPPKVKSSNLPALLSDLRASAKSLRWLVDAAMIAIIIALATIIIVLILTR